MNDENIARVVGHGKRLFGKAKKAASEVASDAKNRILGQNPTSTTEAKFDASELGYKVGENVGKLITQLYGDNVPRAQNYATATKKAVHESTTAIRGGLERIAADVKVASKSITERIATDADRKVEIGKQTYVITDNCVTLGDVARVAGYMVLSSREIPSSVRGRQELLTYIGAQGIYTIKDLDKRQAELSPIAKTALTYLKH